MADRQRLGVAVLEGVRCEQEELHREAFCVCLLSVATAKQFHSTMSIQIQGQIQLASRGGRRARGASQHRLCSRFQDPRLPLGARRRRLAVGRRQHSSADGVQEGKGAAASSASALLRRRGCAAQLLAALLRCFRPMRGRG